MAARPLALGNPRPAHPVFKSGSGMTKEEAAKHNQMFVANLKLAMESLPKYVLGTYAATLLDDAVRETKHDSGRFAANWNLALNGEVPDVMPDPLHYGAAGAKFGSIGKKGDKRFRIAVLMAKRAYYGYRKGPGGFMELTNGKIAAALYARATGFGAKGTGGPQGDMSGGAGRILLYNPFMKPNQRKAGWGPPALRKGQGYTFYAMGKRPDLGPAGPMGSGMLQKRVYELNRLIRSATAAKTLIDPRNVSII